MLTQVHELSEMLFKVKAGKADEEMGHILLEDEGVETIDVGTG